ncbi:LpqB family beta-propeller domain-containing protein [Gephyromycinifex aptenodytis]|uniref:LpqB family beta-propeller domain-containing protein n=1 Tax=Gephyromycinifex aptenodytis TaxID=2716227 RepID=UPI00144777CC|nr:LpqB family beta-propeller domain-containing protein [Gephyromycinifex aptenodytis]
MSRWPRVAAAAVVAALSVAGCSGLPRHSPVEQGHEIGAPVLPPVRFRFEAPPRGAEPTQIVSGFLAAGWSADDDYAAARAYLTPQASQRWTPRSHVVVYESASSLEVTKSSDSTVRIAVSGAAHLDEHGRYTPAPAGEVIAADVRLAKVDGQWRIAAVPNEFGLWLSHFYFERAYRPFDVTYADTRTRVLVADRRWFPTVGGLSTALARAQLEEAPTYLKGVVENNVPAGTTLAVDTVPVTGGVAQVELSRSALEATADQRRAMWAQMLTTLRQVPGVREVSLRVDGRPLALLSAQSEPKSVAELGYSPVAGVNVETVVQRTGSQLTAVPLATWLGRSDETDRLASAHLPSIEATWKHVAIGAELRHTVAVSDDDRRLMVWQGKQPRPVPEFGTGLCAPAIDTEQRLWVAGRSNGATRVWSRPVGAFTLAPSALSAPWLVNRQVQAVAPAPDGRRLALVSTDAAGVPRVEVSGVVKKSGVPARLNQPWTVATDIVEPSAVTWMDDRTLAVVGRHSGGRVAPIIVPLGGGVEPLKGVDTPIQIASLGGPRGLIVVSEDGTVSRRVGTGWQSRGNIDEIIVPAG